MSIDSVRANTDASSSTIKIVSLPGDITVILLSRSLSQKDKAATARSVTNNTAEARATSILTLVGILAHYSGRGRLLHVSGRQRKRGSSDAYPIIGSVLRAAAI